MPRIKSLIERALVDEVGRAHNCQANARHRLKKGDKRLKVRNGRGWDHYCLDCAQTIVGRNIDKLNELMEELTPR